MKHKGLVASDAIDLADAADFWLGRIFVRPSFREMVRDNGRRETIQPRVMQVLVALATADGIVGRSELINRCWGGRVVSEDAINRIISHIRRLSEEIGAGVFRLETISKVGYRLIRSDKETAHAVPARPLPVSQTPAPLIPQSISTSPRVGRRAALVGQGTLVAGAGAAWRCGKPPRRQPRPASSLCRSPICREIRLVRGSVGDAKTAHQVHSPEIVFHGDSADGTWAMQDRVVWSQERAAKMGNLGHTSYGQYHKLYARCDDGRWRIRRQQLTRFHVDYHSA